MLRLFKKNFNLSSTYIGQTNLTFCTNTAVVLMYNYIMHTNCRVSIYLHRFKVLQLNTTNKYLKLVYLAFLKCLLFSPFMDGIRSCKRFFLLICIGLVIPKNSFVR